MSISSDALKVPPHDVEAEKSILGSILIDSAAVHLVAEFLKPIHFYSRENTKIYEAMLSLFEKQQPIDIMTLKNELKLQGSLRTVGGSSYITKLVESVPTSAYVQYYGHIVKDQYVKRKLIEVSSRTVEKAFEEKGEIKSLIDYAEGEIFSLAQENVHKDFIPLKDVLNDSFDRLNEVMNNADSVRGIPSGFVDLDKKLSGFQKSNLVILAARPGVGKTTFALNLALHAAQHARAPIGFFSLEMSKEELVDRLLVGLADIDAWRLKTGKLEGDDMNRLTEAMGELAEVPIFIDDTPGASVLEMRTKARRLKAEHNLGMLIVDYLQLADAGRKFESRVQEVSFISLGLKNLARELKIPVLALSQLSRAVEQRGTKKPQLADLRESGAIEQDADVVMFIYKEDEDDDLIASGKRVVKLDIAKHRNGPTGEIEMMFRGDRVKFYGVNKEL
jgi:replicative DNA helicase